MNAPDRMASEFRELTLRWREQARRFPRAVRDRNRKNVGIVKSGIENRASGISEPARRSSGFAVSKPVGLKFPDFRCQLPDFTISEILRLPFDSAQGLELAETAVSALGKVRAAAVNTPW